MKIHSSLMWPGLPNSRFYRFYTTLQCTKKQIEGVGKRAERVVCNVKTFERKLQIFERNIERGQLKNFPNLNMHLKNSTTFADSIISPQ